MEAETFSDYFTRSFIRNIHPDRTAVLIYDGNTSHIGVGLTEEKQENKI
jgi:hypothetical protein